MVALNGVSDIYKNDMYFLFFYSSRYSDVKNKFVFMLWLPSERERERERDEVITTSCKDKR